MNKKNKILVGCLALLLALSVGYALFSETITINGTAQAKGNFDITTSCVVGIHPDLNATFYDMVDNGSVNDECTYNGNIITAKTELLYPGALRTFTAVLTNSGSVPAVISYSDPDGSIIYMASSYEGKLYKRADDSLHKTVTLNSSEAELNEFSTNYGLFHPYAMVIGVKLADGTIVDDDDILLANDMFYKDSAGLHYLKLNKGDSVYALLMAVWDIEAVQTDYYSSTTMSVNIPFKQFSSDLILDSAGGTCIWGC